MRAIAITGVVVAAFVGLMYARFSGDGVPAPEATATPRPAAASSPTASSPTPAGTPADALQGVASLEIGAALEFPRDVVLMIETGCWQCDGPASGFARVYLDPSGVIREETIFSPEKLDLGPRLVTTDEGVLERQPFITGFAAQPDGSEVTVSVCVKETCGSGGLDAWSADSEVALFRSTDGGVTWEDFGKIEEGGYVIGSLGDGAVLVALYSANLAPASYRRFPGLDPVARPQTGALSAPLVLTDGTIVWPDRSHLRRADGSAILNLPFGGGPHQIEAVFQGPRAQIAVTWLANLPEQPRLISRFDSDGTHVETHELPDFFRFGAWPDARLFGNANFSNDQPQVKPPDESDGYLPAVLEGETIRPLAGPFLENPLGTERNHIVAVQHGPFARVVKTDGTCVNVRAGPLASAKVLDCAAEGVLLRLIKAADAQSTDASWLHVATPSGIEGWASSKYLEH